MTQAKENLHNVQEKTCGRLHSVQHEGMKNSRIRKSYVGDFRPISIFTVVGAPKAIRTEELVMREYAIGSEYLMGRVVDCAASGNRFRPFRITVETAGHETKAFRTYAEAKAAR